MPGAGQSQRNLILLQMLSLLKGLSIDKGDGTTPALVTREFRSVDEVSDYPVLILVEAPLSRVTMSESDLYRHEFGVTVYGYVKKTETRGRSELLEDLWSDVLRKLLGANTLPQDDTGAALCSDIIVTGDRQTDGGAFGEVGAFAQDFTVVYFEQVPGG